MAAANIQVALSDDLNYEAWAPTAKKTLEEKGLWDVVENGVPPNPSKIPELAATIQVEELSKWRDLAVKDMEALQVLQSSLSDSAFRKTVLASSAKEVWDLLGNGNEKANLGRLEKQFEELTMRESEPINSYLERVMEIVDQMRRLKIEKSDYDVIKKVLASLSGSYDDVGPIMGELMDLKKMTLESFVEFFHTYDSISMENIDLMLKLNRLKVYGKWCGVCKNNTHNDEECRITISKGRSSSGTRQAKPKKGECFQCGDRGHKAKDCNTKNQQSASTETQIIEEVYYTFPSAGRPGGGERYRRKQQPGETEVKIDEEEMEVDYILLAKLSLNDFTYDEGMWMIYGHSTSHMTPHEKLFITLDRTYKAKVGLVDGTVMLVEGRGDVKVMMKEGKKKTINNVLYVSGINRNVLSVRQMQSRGCSFLPGERGECIVRDKSGNVFGDTLWDERGLSIRLQVIEGNNN